MNSNRRAGFGLVLGLVGLATIQLTAIGTAWADTSDKDKINTTLAAFNAALSTLDSKKMEEIWAHDADVMLINPRDKTVSLGWEAVRANWEKTMAFWSELKVSDPGEHNIRIDGNVAWVTGIAQVSGKTAKGDPIASAPTFETSILKKQGDAWLIVSHSAWRVPQ